MSKHNGSTPSYIYCTNVVKAYQVSDHEIVALRGINFTMDRGEMIAIVGPSGSGKSSLLNLLGGLDTPTAGQLSIGGLNLLELKGRKLADYRLQQVGFIWQQVGRNLLPHRTSLHNVTLPMMLAGVGRRERVRRAKELLEAVDLSEHMHKRPAQLSGGQQQRVAIAVALANNPKLLLADEPTGSLDHTSALQAMELLSRLREAYSLTVLMVTHDMEMASFADRTLTLRDGALSEDMTTETETPPRLDDDGRIQLPSRVRSALDPAARISVEVTPEGVLLRPEQQELQDTEALLNSIVPQDTVPESEKPRRFRLFRRRSKSTKAQGARHDR